MTRKKKPEPEPKFVTRIPVETAREYTINSMLRTLEARHGPQAMNAHLRADVRQAISNAFDIGLKFKEDTQ